MYFYTRFQSSLFGLIFPRQLALELHQFDDTLFVCLDDSLVIVLIVNTERVGRDEFIFIGVWLTFTRFFVKSQCLFV